MPRLKFSWLSSSSILKQFFLFELNLVSKSHQVVDISGSNISWKKRGIHGERERDTQRDMERKTKRLEKREKKSERERGKDWERKKYLQKERERLLR